MAASSRTGRDPAGLRRLRRRRLPGPGVGHRGRRGRLSGRRRRGGNQPVSRSEPHRWQPCWMKLRTLSVLQPQPTGDRRGRRSVHHQVPQGAGSLYREASRTRGSCCCRSRRGPRPPGWRRWSRSVGSAIDCSSPKEGDLVPWLSQIARRDSTSSSTPQEATALARAGRPRESGILVAELEKLVDLRRRDQANREKRHSQAGRSRPGRDHLEDPGRCARRPESSRARAPRQPASPTAKSRSACSPQ